jgi:hypothetical protein
VQSNIDLAFGAPRGQSLAAQEAPDVLLMQLAQLGRNRRPGRDRCRGIVPKVSAIDLVERPSAANKMIGAQNTSSCSVVGAHGLLPVPVLFEC